MDIPLGEGLDRKDWNELLDKYLSTQKMSADLYAGTNESQRLLIQEIKKAFARLKNKQNG